MKLESKVFRDAANIYLWDGKSPRGELNLGCCGAIYHSLIVNCLPLYDEGYTQFFIDNFRPKGALLGFYFWYKGWRFWTQAAVQRHRKKMLLKAADLVDKMNGGST